MFIMIIFGVALIVAIFYLSKGSWSFPGNRSQDGSPEASPLDILRKRYARGEINKEEFEQKKKDLGY